MGNLCIGSWNKLWGFSRCAALHHVYSDRFVWKRAASCVITSGDYMTGVVPNCADAGKIEIAAYSYDNSLLPFQNIGTLLK